MTAPPPRATLKDGVLLNAKGRPINISPSSAETWWDCKRKWYYAYVLRLPTPQSPSAALGTRVHAMLEDYVGKGIVPGKGKAEVLDPMTGTLVEREVDLSKSQEWGMAQALLPHLPKVVPGKGASGGWRTETQLSARCGPLPFKGFVDLSNITDFPRWKIDDYKTTSSTSFRWSKTTPEALAAAPQPLAYAKAFALTLGKQPDSVDLRHLNVASSTVLDRHGNRHFPVNICEAPDVPWSAVETNWERFAAAAEAQYATARNIHDVEGVTTNTAACRNFGGCPFASICSDSPIARETKKTATKEAPTMSAGSQAAREKLLAMKKGKTAEAKPEAPAKNTKAEAQAKTLAAAIKSRGPLPKAAIEAAAKGYGVDLQTFLNYGGLAVDGAMIVLAGSAPAKPAAKPVSLEAKAADIVEYLNKSGKTGDVTSAMTFISLGIGVEDKDLILLQDRGLVADGALTDLGKLVATRLGVDVDAAPDEPEEEDEILEPEEEADEPEPEPEPEEEPEPEPEEGEPALGAVEAALLQAVREAGGKISKDEAAKVIRAADPNTERVRDQRIEECVRTLTAAGYDARYARIQKLLIIEGLGAAAPAAAKDDGLPGYDDLIGLTSSDLATLSTKLNVAAGHLLDRVGLMEFKGITVPKDFKGTALEAHKQYARDKKHRERVKVVEEVEAAIAEGKSDEEVEQAAKAAKAPAERPPKASPPPREAPPAEATDLPDDAVTVLYVDCLPWGRSVRNFDEILATFERQVEEAGGKVNGQQWDKVEHYTMLDFNKGYDLVVARLVAAMDKGKVLPGEYFISSSHPLASRLLAATVRFPNILTVRAVR